jgi:CxxC motif-containing protein (DUF1111 family)
MSIVCQLLLIATMVIAGCRKPSLDEAQASTLSTHRSDGDSELSVNAYGRALTNLAPEHWRDLRAGKEIFVTTWVASGTVAAERAARGPSSQVREGLGPQFNASSCQSCHFKDGRGRAPYKARQPDPPEGRRVGPPRLLRLGVIGVDGQLAPDPAYGLQLQDRALPPLAPEGDVDITARFVDGRYPDGTPFALEAPLVTLTHLRQGPLGPDARISVRLPPSLIGLGLLEAIPAEAILALADPEDADGDGISGRPHHVRDPASGGLTIGRFGWKASQPSLQLQNATALREDLGVTTPVFPDDGAPELDAAGLEQLTRYTRLLAPPARRGASDPEVARGEAVFSRLGCAGCHRPRFETGEVTDIPELARQPVAPYSDLLLHDMGDALADHRPDGQATGREWRTAPLWGVGLLAIVSGEVRLLHDGRARSSEEAILWHGGEAQPSRDRFTRADRADRAALLRFLDAL